MQGNVMNNLLDKLERRLGTRQLNLPDYLQKDKWAEEVIANETLDTFSRYIPNAVTVRLDRSMRNKQGWYVMDELFGDDITVYGVKDIDWQQFSNSLTARGQGIGYGFYDALAGNYGFDDIMLLQGRADQVSMYNNNIFTEFEAPNLVRFITVTGADITGTMDQIPITVFIKHAPNLKTIPPTMMETFEKLAEADVARFLYENLKYYDGLETVHASIDLKMSDLESKAAAREDVVNELKENYVSAANKHQPIMYTV